MASDIGSDDRSQSFVTDSDAAQANASAVNQDTEENIIDSLDSFARLNLPTLRNVRDFIQVLENLNVKGPLTTTQRLERRFELGRGGQFTVYRNDVLDDADCSRRTTLGPVAAKKCIRFETENISGNATVDLQSSDFQIQVHHMLLEVAALRDSRLHRHRNIVELLGYGVETEAWHKTPFLILELALGNLEKFLSTQHSLQTLQQLCLDVGAGLDLIHSCDLVHGDLKPLNILVFSASRYVPFVAKLSDFGFSVGELDHQGEGSVMLPGCSHGWAAPEVERHYAEHTAITARELVAADNFSYGLLALSSLRFAGRVLPTHVIGNTDEVDLLTDTLPEPLRRNVRAAAASLLRSEYMLRPEQVGTFLVDDSEAYRTWLQASNANPEDDRALSSRYPIARELPPLDAFFVEGIEDTFRHSVLDLTGPQLLAMYLYKSFRDASQSDKSVQVEMLLAAARKGYPPARGIVQKVLSSYGLPASEYLDGEEGEFWLYRAIATGSVSAYRELVAANPGLAQAAMSEFRELSGYGRYSLLYSPSFELPSSEVQDNSLGDADIHRFAGMGQLDQLRAQLDLHPNDIEAYNFVMETPLCKACMAGHSTVVRELCKRGADASFCHGDFSISCLHWLFNFPASDVYDVLQALLEAGAHINHSIAKSRPLANHHYPFTWPTGTPLHWAVATSSQPAILALIKAGADPRIRNRQDPYIDDQNVRQFHRHGNEEQGDFSDTPDSGVQGMNSIDLAVAAHDWESLHAIWPPSAGQKLSLLSADEEGYTPFHRLSHQRVGRTSSGSRFWCPALMGDAQTRYTNLGKTIEWLQAVGGDINKLTGSPSEPGLSGVDGLTPLMIAVTKYDAEAVEKLCTAGADVNLSNRSGRTALTLLYDPPSYYFDPHGTLQAMLAQLTEHEADVNYRTPEGLTPLGSLANVGDVDAFRLLVDNGADMTLRSGNVAPIAQLIHTNATENLFRNRFERDQVEARDRDLSELLLESIRSRRTSVDMEVDEAGATFLHYSAAAVLPACITMLMSQGAGPDLNCRDMPENRGPNSHFSRDRSIHGTALDIINRKLNRFLGHRSASLTHDDAEFIAERMREVRRLLQDI